MNIIRNSINIIGITPEEKLPQINKGQIIIFSEVENIFIPEQDPEIKNIFQINIEIALKGSRSINTPFNKLIVLDGVKKLKIIYTENSSTKQANFLTLENPYNTYLEIPPNYNFSLTKANIYILDAYFDLIGKKKIYSHILYQVDVHHENFPALLTNESWGKNTSQEKELILKMQKLKKTLIKENF